MLPPPPLHWGGGWTFLSSLLGPIHAAIGRRVLDTVPVYIFDRPKVPPCLMCLNREAVVPDVLRIVGLPPVQEFSG